MVCSVTNIASKDDVVTKKAIHPGRSFGDGNEIARDPYTRSWSGSPTNPHATTKFVSGNAEFETGHDNSLRSARGSMVHKMQRPGA